MSTSSTLRAAVVACALAATAPAQNLDLAVSGGSMPGTFDIGVSGGLPFEFVLLVPSSNAGPTPLGLIDLIARGYGTLTIGFIVVFVIPVLTLGVWKLRAAGAEPA